MLAQTEVEAEGNETSAIPALLQMLDLSGYIVTIDAIGCQKSIVQLLTEGGADYVLALKRNQAQLHDDVKEMFSSEREREFVHLPHDCHQTVAKDHDRIELRRCWATAAPEFLDYMNPDEDWTQLQSLVMVECERRFPDHSSCETRYFISSLPPDAKQLLAATRGHWSIENSVHWVLDVAFREDESRIRQGKAQHDLATLRRMALNLLRHEKTARVGVAAKRQQAGWNGEYLLKMPQPLDAIALGDLPGPCSEASSLLYSIFCSTYWRAVPSPASQTKAQPPECALSPLVVGDRRPPAARRRAR